MSRLASFVVDGRRSYGVIDGSTARDIGAVLGHRYGSLRKVVAADAVGAMLAVTETAPQVPVDSLTWLPPIRRPRRMICVGLNYHDHVAESDTPKPTTTHPTLFLRLPSSVVGHDEPVVAPAASEVFDYEGEIAVVIGKPGRHISAETAMDHVLGLSAFQDGSVRDYQRHTTQFTPGKNFDRSGSWGPWITTIDEFDDLSGVTVTTRLDGEVMQHASLAQLITTIPELIAYCSTFTELEPGDVIATGTPGGVGVARDPQILLSPGRLLEIEVSGVGVLSNPIVAE